MPTRTTTKGRKALFDAIETIDEEDSATAAEVADGKAYSHDAALASLRFLEMRGMVERKSERSKVFYKCSPHWFGVR